MEPEQPLNGGLCKNGLRRFSSQKYFASNFALWTIFGSKYIKPDWFLVVHQIKFLRALNNQSCKRPFFWSPATSKISKVDKLAPRNTLYAARNRLYSWIVRHGRGLESVSVLVGVVYSEIRHNLFKNTR